MALTSQLPFMHRLVVQRARWARLVHKIHILAAWGELSRSTFYLHVVRRRVFLARLRAALIQDRLAARAATNSASYASACLECLWPVAHAATAVRDKYTRAASKS